MVRIERYIERLLLKHDCVIIPDLGGFVSHYEPAYRDEESAMFYPPFRTISFNASLTINDGLLVQAYMQAFDTNFPEATRIVENEIKKISEQLHSVGQYNFEHLGLLEMKSGGELLFTPESEGGIAAPDLYGLDAFTTQPFDLSETEEDVSEPQVQVPVQTTEKPINSEEEDIIFNEKPRTKYYTIHLNKTVTNYVAAAIIAIIAYFAFAIPTIDNHSSQNLLNASNGAIYGFPVKKLISTQAETEKAKSVSIPAMQPTEKKLKQTAPANEEIPQPATTVKETENSPYYTIVLASSVKRSNAEDLVKRLKMKKLPEAKVFEGKNMLRVIYSHYSSQEEATTALRTLREYDEFEDAWVLEIK